MFKISDQHFASSTVYAATVFDLDKTDRQPDGQKHFIESSGANFTILAGSPGAVGSVSDCESRGRWFEPRSGHILLLRFGHEKNPMTNLSFPLIKEGQLSVTGERMGTKYL